MVDSWYFQDRVIPEEMSQVVRQLEVGNHKRRTLNTRLSFGTSAGTFAVSAGPYAGRRTDFRDKNLELFSGELFSGEELLPENRFLGQ